jgi:sulfite exporter TauE/SafE/copper chaperone CopZ
MEMYEKKNFSIEGMTCTGCEQRIESKLRSANGILAVRANFSASTVKVSYYADVISERAIQRLIESEGYRVNRDETKRNDIKASEARLRLMRAVTTMLTLVAGYHVASRFGLTDFLTQFPQAQAGMSLGTLLIIGMLTSVHCVAMCGGINLTQSIQSSGKSSPFLCGFYYNAGRVVSYTLIGGIVGGIGSVVTLTGPFKGAIALGASIFMMIMGITMLNLFPGLRRFTPRMPRFIASRVGNAKSQHRHRPFMIGLLNGLMPCGPLQAMQLYALSTGNVADGALAMFAFSLGTVPLMVGFSAISSMLSQRFTARMLEFSAVLVIVLGFGMFQTGLSVSGIQIPAIRFPSLFDGQVQNTETTIKDGVQYVTSEVYNGRYEPITVKAGVPLRWTVHVGPGQLSGCNYKFTIQGTGITVQLKEGNNLVEFTPRSAKVLNYDCWMGMIRSYINVVE